MRVPLSTVVLAVVLGCTTVVVLGGWRPVILLSGSMSPGAPAGSLLIARPVSAADIAIGDVVVARPVNSDRPVTHRVVAFTDDRSGAWTRGDANTDVDPAPVPLVGDLLVMRWALPGAGRGLMALTARNALAAGLIGAGLLTLARAMGTPPATRPHLQRGARTADAIPGRDTSPDP